MAEIVLIRGLPGSGKSTRAKAMSGYKHIEADMYFQRDGEYRHDKNKIQLAHAWCLAEAKAALENGENVVVANTFTCQWEMKPYIDLGYSFRIEIATGSFQNIHGVPAATIEKMRIRWES